MQATGVVEDVNCDCQVRFFSLKMFKNYSSKQCELQQKKKNVPMLFLKYVIY